MAQFSKSRKVIRRNRVLGLHRYMVRIAVGGGRANEAAQGDGGYKPKEDEGLPQRGQIGLSSFFMMTLWSNEKYEISGEQPGR
jgi:hypothetical protein